MKVLVSGSTGLVASVLIPLLKQHGYDVVRLVRSNASGTDIAWNPDKQQLDVKALEGVDAVIHLAGESIASGRWTPDKKNRIRDSRIKGTQLLANTLAAMETPPKAFISASAIGYYGNRNSEILTETSALGTGFLPNTCKDWETATHSAAAKEIRTTTLRFGIILSPHGGALQKMLPPFLMGAGGILGSGKQYMSWIDIDDVAGAILHVLKNETLTGPVNVVAPTPVTNSEFTKVMGKVLIRPTFSPFPAFGIKLLFGEMGEELLLSSSRVDPSKLLESGYSFKFPTLEGSLRHLLSK
jgi:uncharacterized protein